MGEAGEAELELNLDDVLQALRRRAGWVAFLVAACVATAGVLSFFVIAPVYGANALLVVLPADAVVQDTGMLSFNRQLSSTYARIATSRAVLVEAARSAGLSPDAERLRGLVSVRTVAGTELIEVRAEGASPEDAASLANAVARAAIAEVSRLYKLENLQLLESASPPDAPVRPRKLLNMAVGGMLGLMLGVALALYREFGDVTLRTEEQVARHLGLPVLGAIPEIRVSPRGGAVRPAWPAMAEASAAQEAPESPNGPAEPGQDAPSNRHLPGVSP